MDQITKVKKKKKKSSHLPLVVFGQADTFGSMCQVFDIFASESIPMQQRAKERKLCESVPSKKI